MLGISAPGSFVVIAGVIFRIEDPTLAHPHEPALQMKGDGETVVKDVVVVVPVVDVHPSAACLLHIWASAQMVVVDALPAAGLTVHV
jgi:hypothetical protein